MNRVRAVLASVVAAVCVITGSLIADADPTAVEQARVELERIQQESSAIDQQIIEAYERVSNAEAALETLRADVAEQELKVATLVGELGDVAALQFQTDSVSLTAQLLTSSSSDNFLSGLATLQTEVARSNAGIQQLQLDQAKLTTLREDAAATEAALKRDHAAKLELADDYAAKEAEAQQVFDKLSEEERQRLAAIEAERQRQAAAAQAEAEARAAAQQAASRSREATATTAAAPAAPVDSDSAAPAPAPVAAGSGRAQAAVDAAVGMVGSRYVWGTSGPRTFDCSGLTSWAYRQVGVNLTRSSRAQFSSAGHAVSKSDLKPGDLVFYYRPVSHVGIYIGGGKIVDAANPRTGVRIASLDSMPFAGARRVIG